MHSKECLSFLPRYLHRVPGVSGVVRRYQRPSSGAHPRVDFARAYWTPPLTPATALHVERKQIAKLGLRPIVSLTDHDDIEACNTLRVTADPATVPVSVEWTVPYGASILHLGIHNLPPGECRLFMAAMEAYTAAPKEDELPELLRAVSRMPETLTVLNHPFWLEEGVSEAGHRCALDRFLRECLEWVHAFELNGTRKWRENADAMALAEAHGRPPISGGDRHACEPGACINLTNARSFSEFAAEVRQGDSSILFMSHYREPMALRMLEAIGDILRRYPEYPGRERWTDRVFYGGEDGVTRPLSAIWRETPWALEAVAGTVQLVAGASLRPAIRLLLAERGEVLP
jgi:predicted metal-dependent phosphoesterase TrpH